MYSIEKKSLFYKCKLLHAKEHSARTGEIIERKTDFNENINFSAAFQANYTDVSNLSLVFTIIFQDAPLLDV